MGSTARIVTYIKYSLDGGSSVGIPYYDDIVWTVVCSGEPPLVLTDGGTRDWITVTLHTMIWTGGTSSEF